MPFSPLLFLVREQYEEFFNYCRRTLNWLVERNLVEIRSKEEGKALVSSAAFSVSKAAVCALFLGAAHFLFKRRERKAEWLEHASEAQFILETNRKIVFADLCEVDSRFRGKKSAFAGDSLAVEDAWERDALAKCFNGKGNVQSSAAGKAKA